MSSVSEKKISIKLKNSYKKGDEIINNQGNMNYLIQHDKTYDLSKIGYVYLLIEREFITLNQSIYKIGQTQQTPPWERFKNYPKKSEVFVLLIANNSKEMEQQIKNQLKKTNNIIHRKDIGEEYFEGDIETLIKVYNEQHINYLIRDVNLLKKWQQEILQSTQTNDNCSNSIQIDDKFDQIPTLKFLPKYLVYDSSSNIAWHDLLYCYNHYNNVNFEIISEEANSIKHDLIINFFKKNCKRINVNNKIFMGWNGYKLNNCLIIPDYIDDIQQFINQYLIADNDSNVYWYDIINTYNKWKNMDIEICSHAAKQLKKDLIDKLFEHGLKQISDGGKICEKWHGYRSKNSSCAMQIINNIEEFIDLYITYDDESYIEWSELLEVYNEYCNSNCKIRSRESFLLKQNLIQKYFMENYKKIKINNREFYGWRGHKLKNGNPDYVQKFIDNYLITEDKCIVKWSKIIQAYNCYMNLNIQCYTIESIQLKQHMIDKYFGTDYEKLETNNETFFGWKGHRLKNEFSDCIQEFICDFIIDDENSSIKWSEIVKSYNKYMNVNIVIGSKQSTELRKEIISVKFKKNYTPITIDSKTYNAWRGYKLKNDLISDKTPKIKRATLPKNICLL